MNDNTAFRIGVIWAALVVVGFIALGALAVARDGGVWGPAAPPAPPVVAEPQAPDTRPEMPAAEAWAIAQQRIDQSHYLRDAERLVGWADTAGDALQSARDEVVPRMEELNTWLSDSTTGQIAVQALGAAAGAGAGSTTGSPTLAALAYRLTQELPELTTAMTNKIDDGFSAVQSITEPWQRVQDTYAAASEHPTPENVNAWLEAIEAMESPMQTASVWAGSVTPYIDRLDGALSGLSNTLTDVDIWGVETAALATNDHLVLPIHSRVERFATFMTGVEADLAADAHTIAELREELGGYRLVP